MDVIPEIAASGFDMTPRTNLSSAVSLELEIASAVTCAVSVSAAMRSREDSGLSRMKMLSSQSQQNAARSLRSCADKNPKFGEVKIYFCSARARSAVAWVTFASALSKNAS